MFSTSSCDLHISCPHLNHHCIRKLFDAHCNRTAVLCVHHRSAVAREGSARYLNMFSMNKMHSNDPGFLMVFSASQEFDLVGSDDSRMSVEHDHPDEAGDIIELMMSGGAEMHKDIGRDQRLFNPFRSVRPLVESPLQRDEACQPAILKLTGNSLLTPRAGINCNPMLISFIHGASDALLRGFSTAAFLS